MVATVDELIGLLDLEALEPDTMRGPAPATSLQRVFGGQVLAQALMAAMRTVDSTRAPHSLHGYFLRPGDPATPIVYMVERVRDGRSFSTRRVVARQHGRPIFHMTASLQEPEDGPEHQASMPAAAPPDGLPSLNERIAGRGSTGSSEWAALDVLYAREEMDWQQVWLRTSEPLPDDPALHACVLAYASDLTLLGTALRPHGLEFDDPGLATASIDHALWFHRPARMDDWLLYDQDTPSSSGSRGLARGLIYSIDGRLIASTVQEGLMRVAISSTNATTDSERPTRRPTGRPGT